jgi:hypothetical protein
MGEPQENTIEISDGVLVEIMAADGEFTHLILEFLDGLLADGGATAGKVKAQEIEALNEVGNSSFVGGQAETQLLSKHIIHEVQGLFGSGVIAAQDHEVVSIADKAKASLHQSMVEKIEDDICQERRNDTALRGAGECRKESEIFHYTSREELAEDIEDTTVGHLFGDQVDDEVMGDGIEER